MQNQNLKPIFQMYNRQEIKTKLPISNYERSLIDSASAVLVDIFKTAFILTVWNWSTNTKQSFNHCAIVRI